MSQSAAVPAGPAIRDIVLPPQPEVLLIAQRELGKPEPDVRALVAALRKDISLSAEVLRIVNSARFGLPRKTASVSEALSYLGVAQTAGIIANAELRRSFAAVPGITMQRFWDTAHDVARHAVFIARSLRTLASDDVYAAGLFRDCGVPVMAQKFADYPAVMNEANAAVDERFTGVEDRHYQTSHAIVGYYLARSWNLPPLIADAILYHDDVEDMFSDACGHRDELRQMVAILKLAGHVNDLFRKREEKNWDRLRPPLLEYLEMTEYQYEDMVANLLDQQDTFD